jgi:GNAT superfamily N-acetyltransferase
MEGLTIRPKRPEDDEFVVDLRNQLNDHLPPGSVANFRHWEKIDLMAENALVERQIAELNGRCVAACVIERMLRVPTPNGFFGGVSVLPELWGQGIGSRLYEGIVARLKDLGAERLYVNIRNDVPHSQQFAVARGFEKTGHADRWSRLDPRSANLEGYIEAEERMKSEGLTIKTLAETGQSDDFLHKLHLAQDEAVADIPMSEAYTGTPYEMFLEELKEPSIIPERIWIALDGDEPVGLASLPVEDSGMAYNGFTGVRRSHRGKGVARALKLMTVRWAAENGVPYIYTANDVNNTRMLSINDSLGYEVLPISEEYVKTFGEAE